MYVTRIDSEHGYPMNIAPPTPPRNLSSNPQPFSSNFSWSPPEDNGGDPNPLTYTINVTNDTLTMMYNTSGLELQLTNLQHSTNYTVSLVAVNVFGSSQPAVVDVFRTSDTGECTDMYCVLFIGILLHECCILFRAHHSQCDL